MKNSPMESSDCFGQQSSFRRADTCPDALLLDKERDRILIQEKFTADSEIMHLLDYLRSIHNEYWPQRFTFSPLFATRWDWNQLLISVQCLLTDAVGDRYDSAEIRRLLQAKKDEVNLYLTGVCRDRMPSLSDFLRYR